MSDDIEALRPYLTGLAYRMLGSWAEAEDVVQDVMIKWLRQPRGDIRAPKAWATTATTRAAIDALRSARVSRETYVGPWLPEPILVDDEQKQLKALETADGLSMALLVVLEQLGARERAAFLLREVFDHSYDEIAQILDIRADNARQLVARAKKKVTANRPVHTVDTDDHQALLDVFTGALETGDLGPLIDHLAEEVVVYSDGGGKTRAALNPIYGRDKCFRFLQGLYRKAPDDIAIRPARINGDPGILIYFGSMLFSTWSFEVIDGQVQNIWAVVNPDKLGKVRGQTQLPP